MTKVGRRNRVCAEGSSRAFLELLLDHIYTIGRRSVCARDGKGWLMEEKAMLTVQIVQRNLHLAIHYFAHPAFLGQNIEIDESLASPPFHHSVCRGI